MAVIWYGKLFVGVTMWFQVLAVFSKTLWAQDMWLLPRATSLGCNWDTGSSAEFLLLKAGLSRRDPAFGTISVLMGMLEVWFQPPLLPQEEVLCLITSWNLVIAGMLWLCSIVCLLTLTRGLFWSERPWTGCVLWKNLLTCLAKYFKSFEFSCWHINHCQEKKPFKIKGKRISFRAVEVIVKFLQWMNSTRKRI